jgi:2-phosphosulfolactate phosphatase
MRVDIALLPPREPPTQETCLVVDVLRATSSMAVLLGRGAAAVFPVGSADGALEYRDALVPDALVSGEVRALPPEGFDYGNSAVEFANLDASVIAGRRFVVATTNGTPALLACSQAPLVLAAAPLNATAVVDAAIDAGNDVLVVCAGLRSAAAEDDGLAAGLLASRLVARGLEPTEGAREMIARYAAVSADLAAAFRATEHGANLMRLGFDADVEFCATADLYAVAGVLTALPEGWALVP